QVGHLDSSLAVRAEDKILLNINDCDLPVSTMRSMRRDLGPIDVLLDQFSIAGWPGNADDARRKEESRRRVMRKFLQDIETFEPRYVIPFASFVRFSHRENAHMNLHVNTIDDVAERVAPSRLVVMYPGDVWDLSGPFAGTARAVERYRSDFGRIRGLPTLGVSGRMSLNSHELPFRRLKKLGALYSSKVYTREASSFLNRRLLGYLWERRLDLYSHYLQRVI